MTARPWWLWGFGVVGVAIVALLAVIAYALLTGDDDGSESEVPGIAQGATATLTATPRVTPSPTPPAATSELSPTPCPDCPDPTPCPACPEPVTCPACICPTCPESPACPPPTVCPDCPKPSQGTCSLLYPCPQPTGPTASEQAQWCSNARAQGSILESQINICEMFDNPCTYEREELANVEAYLNAYCR